MGGGLANKRADEEKKKKQATMELSSMLFPPQQEAAALLTVLGCWVAAVSPLLVPLPKMETQHGLPVTPGFNQL